MNSISSSYTDGSDSPLSINSASNIYAESVTKEVKQFYDDLLNEINAILAKPNPTQQDADDLAEALNKLNQLKTTPPGLTVEMQTFSDILIGLVPINPTTGGFDITPNTIKALSTFELTIGGEKMLLTDAIKTMTSPENDAKNTEVLGDMLLRFANETYDMYMKQLEDLNEQLAIATAVINNLGVLEDALQQTELVDGGGFKFPPESVSDIPKEMLDKIPNKEDPIGWIKKNTDTYLGWVEDYYGAEVKVKPSTGADSASSINNVLTARDELQKQLDAMLAADPNIDKGPTSAYGTTKQALDDLEKYFPTSQYPPGTRIETTTVTTTEQVPVYKYVNKKNPDGSNVVDSNGNVVQERVLDGYETKTTTTTQQCFVDKNGNPLKTPTVDDASKSITSYIIAGEDAGSTISQHLDKAVQANQNLSNRMTDEIKIQNANLQTMFDILTSLMSELNNQLTGFARNINR